MNGTPMITYFIPDGTRGGGCLLHAWPIWGAAQVLPPVRSKTVRNPVTGQTVLLSLETGRILGNV